MVLCISTQGSIALAALSLEGAITTEQITETGHDS